MTMNHDRFLVVLTHVFTSRAVVFFIASAHKNACVPNAVAAKHSPPVGPSGDENNPSPEKRITPAEVQWPASAAGAAGTSGVAGIQTVILKGDPTKAGLYTLLLRLGPNQRIQAHSHRDDRVATVISGRWYFGYGRQFNEAALKETHRRYFADIATLAETDASGVAR